MSAKVYQFSRQRTHEEVLRQLEARYAELEAEAERRAADPARQFPCATCRHADHFEAAWCHHPLVKGFGDKFHMGMDSSGIDSKRYPSLCGPEKALWEPQKLPKSLWMAFNRLPAPLFGVLCGLVLVGAVALGVWLA